DVVDVPNVLRRVAIHENHVSQFSRGYDATVFVHTHYQSGRPRCHAQNFRRSDPGAHIKLELVVKRVSGERIGSWNNRQARVVNCLEQTQHRRESFAIGCLFIWWNFERAAPHGAPHLWRKARHDLFQPGRNRARIAAKESFKDAYRRVEDGVMLPEKIDEFAHLRFVRSKFASALGDLDEAISITRLLHFRKQEVKHDKIKMLDFVSAAFDELPCGHERGHVPAYPQSPRMGTISDDRDQLRFD